MVIFSEATVHKVRIQVLGQNPLANATKLALSIIGVLLMIGGAVFTFQGLGMLGPSSGFMYNNSQWIYNGAIVLVVGIVLLALGLGMKSKPAEQPPPTEKPAQGN
jgi:hypothetical protein